MYASRRVNENARIDRDFKRERIHTRSCRVSLSGIITEGNDLPFCLQAEVEVVEQYSDPRDSKSKAYVEPGAESSLPTVYSRANRNYCRPYTGKALLEASGEK